MTRLLLFILCIGMLGCPQNESQKEDDNSSQGEQSMTHPNPLVNHVRKAINPEFQDWVLFSNGTYIIFEEVAPSDSLRSKAIEYIKQWGPVHGGGPAGDFGTIELNKTEGWIVSGHGYGMYTYVNPEELKTESPSDLEVGLLGRFKRDKDSKELEIIHINRAE